MVLRIGADGLSLGRWLALNMWYVNIVLVMMIAFSYSLLFHFLRLEMFSLSIMMTSSCRIFLRSVGQFVVIHMKLKLLASKVNLVLINNELRKQQRIMLHLHSFRWTRWRLSFILLDILYVDTLPLRMLTLPKLPIHCSNTKRHICFGPFFLNLIFELLMQTHSSIADKNIIDLFKVEIDVIMMMSIVSFVFLVLSFILLFCSWVHIVRAAFFLTNVLLLRLICFVGSLNLGHVCVVLIFWDFSFVYRVVEGCVLRLHLEALAALELIWSMITFDDLLFAIWFILITSGHGATARLVMDFCILTVVVWIWIHYRRRINNYGLVLNRVIISRQKVLPFNISFAIWTNRHIISNVFTILCVVLLSLIHVIALSGIHLLSHGVIKLICFIQLHVTRIDLYTVIDVCLIISWCVIPCFNRILCIWQLCLSAVGHIHSCWLVVDSTLASRWHVG